MALYKLHIEEFDEVDYELIAIHTSLEDYRLAYFLNPLSELLPPFTPSHSSPFRRHSITSLAVDDEFGKPTKEEKKIPKTTWGKVNLCRTHFMTDKSVFQSP